MRPLATRFLTPWLRLLSLPTQPSPAWHLARLHDELLEYRLAATPIEKLSESSDVYFALHRAAYDGCPIPIPAIEIETGKLPPASVLMYAYMIAKFTLRWGFYRVAAGCCRREGREEGEEGERRGRWGVREVVNPGKESKLDAVAGRNGINKVEFRRVAGWLRWVWVLLP